MAAHGVDLQVEWQVHLMLQLLKSLLLAGLMLPQLSDRQLSELPHGLRLRTWELTPPTKGQLSSHSRAPLS
jgi:hypothetical protein